MWKRFQRLRRREPLTVKITGSRVLVVVLCAALAACAGALANNAQTVEFRAQDQIAQHYNSVQPLPVATGRSQIRQNLTELELSEMVGTQTTTFFCPGYGCGKTTAPFKVCPSIGPPIQVTDQLSNPTQPLREASQPLNDTGGNVVVDQMDPNGIYQGNGSGTYVLCVRGDGSVKPSYWEGNVYSEWGAAHWDSAVGQVVDDGPSPFHFSVHTGSSHYTFIK